MLKILATEKSFSVPIDVCSDVVNTLLDDGTLRSWYEEQEDTFLNDLQATTTKLL